MQALSTGTDGRTEDARNAYANVHNDGGNGGTTPSGGVEIGR